jgi:hypothetical protein
MAAGAHVGAARGMAGVAVSAQERPETRSVGTDHPAYQALLKHAMSCDTCADGGRCVTGDVLLTTLRDAYTRGE